MTRRAARFGFAIATAAMMTGLAGSALAQPASPQQSQTQQQAPPPDPKTPPAQTTTTSPQPSLPVNVDKIRTDLQKPRLNINDDRARFFLEVHAPPISFMSLVGSYDLRKGPSGGAALTTREMNQMMTPREMYSSAGITATDLLQFAATNFAAQSLIKRAAAEIRNAKNQQEINDIRARIDRELAALMGGKDKS
jgi:glucose/arabinose dehydrogenase